MPEIGHVLQNFIRANKNMINCPIVNLDGSHTLAKKGGEKTAYQGRKKSIPLPSFSYSISSKVLQCSKDFLNYFYK